MLFDARPALFVTKPCSIFAIFALALMASIASAGEKWILRVEPIGQTRQVQTELKVEGMMKVNPDGKKLREYPMQLEGSYEFVEQVLDAQQAIRFYRMAKAESKANDQPLKDQLPKVKSVIAAVMEDQGPFLFCPEYTLTRQEVDLVQVVGDPLALTGSMPQKEIEVGEAWEIDEITLVQMFGIDALQSSDVQGKLTGVDDGIGKIAIQGSVSGAFQGVASEIRVTARLNIDIKERRITWFAASIHEVRSIGHASPGFDVKAVVRTQVVPAKPVEQFSKENLEKLDLSITPGARLLAYEGNDCGVRLMHDRQWMPIAETAKRAVFRRVVDGELVGQVNISRLTDLKPEEHNTLEGFKSQVEKVLGDKLGQVVDAGQRVNSQGLRELRITAVGTANSLPITWVYYMFSNDEGRRYSAVFTYETKLADQFAEADRSLMSGFSFLDLTNPTLQARSVKQQTR